MIDNECYVFRPGTHQTQTQYGQRRSFALVHDLIRKSLCCTASNLKFGQSILIDNFGPVADFVQEYLLEINVTESQGTKPSFLMKAAHFKQINTEPYQ